MAMVKTTMERITALLEWLATGNLLTPEPEPAHPDVPLGITMDEATAYNADDYARDYPAESPP